MEGDSLVYDLSLEKRTGYCMLRHQAVNEPLQLHWCATVRDKGSGVIASSGGAVAPTQVMIKEF
jgi:hypothetical protein